MDLMAPKKSPKIRDLPAGKKSGVLKGARKAAKP
jgi:hypothetical protein